MSQGRDIKSNSNNNESSSKSKSTKMNDNKNEDESLIFDGLHTPKPNNTSKSKLNIISSINNLATKPITPIPAIKNNKPRFMKFNIFNNVSKQQQTSSIAAKKQSRSNSERSTPQLIVTPAPKNKKIKRLSDDHDTDNQHHDKNKENKEKDKDEEEEDDSEIVKFNLSSLCTPTANKRYQMRSPAPNDVNGRILCSTPAKFPLVMPPTPIINKKIEKQQEAICDRFFKKHKPILTPAKVCNN